MYNPRKNVVKLFKEVSYKIEIRFEIKLKKNYRKILPMSKFLI